MRWFGLVCFVILLIMAWRRKNLRNYAIALGVGCIVGLTIDYFGITLGLWEFPRQSFLSWQYFLIVIPCWGVFGATINMLNDWYMKKRWLSIFLSSLLVMGLYELPNLITGSWSYTASAIIICVGWYPLIIVYRLSYLFVISRSVRRKILSVWEYQDVSYKIGASNIIEDI